MRKIRLEYLLLAGMIPMILGLSFFLYDFSGRNNQIEISESGLGSDSAIYVKNHNTPVDSLLMLSASLIRQGNYHQAMNAAEQFLKKGENNKDFRAIGDAKNKIATIYYYQGEFIKALQNFEDGIINYEKAGFSNGIATLINNKGAIYYYLGNFPKALEHYKKAATLNATLNNKMQSATTIQNIGGIYVELEEYDLAMEYYESARKTYRELKDTLSLSQIKNSIGDVFLRKGSYDPALSNFRESLRLAKSINAKQSILEVYYNLGDVHQLLKQHDKALIYFNKAEQLAGQLNNSLYQSLTQIGLGTTYFENGQVKRAIGYCRNSLRISEKNQTISIQQDACNCLYEAYKIINQNDQALFYLERAISLKDSLHSRQTADKLLNMEFEKKMILDSLAHSRKEQKIALAHKEELMRNQRQRNIIITVLGFILVIAIAVWSRLRYMKRSKKRLQKEKDRSEHLLLNILPDEIAEELKTKGFVDTQDFELAAILFTDFKSFTTVAAQLSPKDLVQELNICFKAFDHIVDRYQIEKIKTIGDSYMAVGGIQDPGNGAIKNTVLAALEMQEFIASRKLQNDFFGKPSFEMRVGVHTGPIIAGVVGVKKFQYDVWGDAVNTASRMESHGEPGCVNISKNTYLKLKDDLSFSFVHRGKISAKGKGDIDMYFVSLADHEVPVMAET